jgi:hypothetical protein
MRLWVAVQPLALSAFGERGASIGSVDHFLIDHL